MPIPVLSLAQMRHWEQSSWAAGQRETEVIRRVGQCVGREILRLSRPEQSVLIVAGKGHNGDDARAALEGLGQRRVELLQVSEPAPALAQLQDQLSRRPALVVDALFGIGLNRPLSADWVEFIQRLNQAALPVLAVDVPSGLNADSGQAQGAAVQASVTLTVGAPKTGLLQASAWPYVGRLEVASQVGLVACPCQSELQWTLAEDFEGYPPARPVASHKGTYGHVAIVAGSPGYHGAAVLAARGAQRAQPGLVTLFTLEGVYSIVAAQLQAVMVSPWQAQRLTTGSWDALVIGPGLASSQVPEALRLEVAQLWRLSPLPLVVDASALDWLPPEPFPAQALRVLTPHPGEAARLLGCTPAQVQADRLGALRRLSSRFANAWVVLKGHQSLIGRSSGEVFVNGSGNPHLAQGGSGDVLAGFLGGLLAQQPLRAEPLRTLRLGVWQHGAAADRLQASHPNWVVEELFGALGGPRA